jgi:4-diphosphocytidyl-2-C-methyl-D-erythritol kinase
MGVLLVQPAFGVATRDAYRWFGSTKPPERHHVQALQVPWFLGPLELGNDLEPPVAERHPEILEIRRALLRHGAEVALMSGSGSAVFGLFPTVEHARRASARLARSAWTVTATRTLGRAACRRRSRPVRAPGF